jgi:hypothetical protein
VAIPADRNIMRKEVQSKLLVEYKSLCIEIKRMWNMKRTIIPAVIGATGIVTKGLKNNLGAIAVKHSTDSPQKTSILGTAHITRKVLQS